jgi:hypothetical protein
MGRYLGFFQQYGHVGKVLSWVLSWWNDLPSAYVEFFVWESDIFTFCHFEKREFFFRLFFLLFYRPAIFKSAESSGYFACLPRIFSDLRNKWYATIILDVEIIVTHVYYETNQQYLPS